MSSSSKFGIGSFSKIDDVVYSDTAEEAWKKAYELASLWTDGPFYIPNVKEFAEIIKSKGVE